MLRFRARVKVEHFLNLRSLAVRIDTAPHQSSFWIAHVEAQMLLPVSSPARVRPRRKNPSPPPSPEQTMPWEPCHADEPNTRDRDVKPVRWQRHSATTTLPVAPAAVRWFRRTPCAPNRLGGAISLPEPGQCIDRIDLVGKTANPSP